MSNDRGWEGMILPGIPELIVGWRPKPARIDAAAVELSRDVAGELADKCRQTLVRLENLTPRFYGGSPQIEPGEEYLEVPVGNLPRCQSAAGEPDDDLAGMSDLQRLIATIGLPSVSRNELRDGSYLFYAVICAEKGTGHRIGFVRQINPYRVAKTGKLMTLLGQEGLQRLEEPLFVFDEGFDLVLTPERVAVLRLEAFNRMFADLNTLAASAPANAKLVADAVSQMTPEAVQALSDAASERPSLARRLQQLTRADAVPGLTPGKLTRAMSKHQLNPADIVVNGEISFGPDKADVFLDLIEQLYYQTDFTREHRRADRYSPLRR